MEREFYCSACDLDLGTQRHCPICGAIGDDQFVPTKDQLDHLDD